MSNEIEAGGQPVEHQEDRSPGWSDRYSIYADARVYSRDEWEQIQSAEADARHAQWVADLDWVIAESGGKRQWGEAPGAKEEAARLLSEVKRLRGELGISGDDAAFRQDVAVQKHQHDYRTLRTVMDNPASTAVDKDRAQRNYDLFWPAGWEADSSKNQ